MTKEQAIKFIIANGHDYTATKSTITIIDAGGMTSTLRVTKGRVSVAALRLQLGY
jgi:hypothetical protein